MPCLWFEDGNRNGDFFGDDSFKAFKLWFFVGDAFQHILSHRIIDGFDLLLDFGDDHVNAKPLIEAERHMVVGRR